MSETSVNKSRMDQRASSSRRADEIGMFLLRGSFAILLLFHGYREVNSGAQFVIHGLSGTNIPASLAQLTYLLEIASLLMILFGLWTKAAALAVAINLAAAIPFIYIAEQFSLWVRTGWTLELHLLYLVIAIVVVFHGAGKYSLGGTNGRWN